MEPVDEKLIQVPTTRAYIEEQTGISFPERLGDLGIFRVDDMRKIDPGLGQGALYLTANVKATIFVYNWNKIVIQTGASDPDIWETFFGSIRDVQKEGGLGYYMDITSTDPQSFSLKTATGKQDFLWVRFTYTEIEGETSTNKSSWLLITGYKNHFIKIRYTSDADPLNEDETSDNHIGYFLDDLSHLFDL